MDVSRHLRRNVVAYLALFVALSGTSYAAAKLPSKSVGSAQLKSNAVTSAKVKDRSLRAKDFKSGELPAGKTGAVGAKGAGGAQGVRGLQGLPGAAGALVGQDTAASSDPMQMPDGQGPALRTVTLNLPRAGRLYVYGHALMLGYCDQPGSHVRLGLWLDDVGVPGTKRDGDDFTAPGASLDLAAVTSKQVGDGSVIGAGGVVAAGQHTLKLLARCTGTEAPAEHGSGEYMAGALLLAP